MAIKLEIKNLYKIFGEHPQRAFKYIEQGLSKEQILEKTGLSLGVKDASLAIEEGEIFVIMGLSGSGKSTMVRLLNRLIEPTRGQVLIDGVDIAKISDAELREVRRKKIAMVFQSFALMPHMTVLDNTAFGMELAGINAEERREKALDALRQVGLENYAHSYPDELSGGMRQRVGLARALAINPDILLMDEAFSALDPLIRTEMQDELVKLQAKHQRTIVFISHDLDEAMRIGDRIAIMQNGEVVQVGTPDEILNNPANDYVRTFFRGVDISQVFTVLTNPIQVFFVISQYDLEFELIQTTLYLLVIVSLISDSCLLTLDFCYQRIQVSQTFIQVCFLEDYLVGFFIPLILLVEFAFSYIVVYRVNRVEHEHAFAVFIPVCCDIE